jgi:hypothetical protein
MPLSHMPAPRHPHRRTPLQKSEMNDGISARLNNDRLYRISCLFVLGESREQEGHDKAVTREPHRGKLHAPTEKEQDGQNPLLNNLFTNQ